MSRQNIEAFYQEVQTETSLQEQLAATQDRESLVNLAVKLGSEKGYDFNVEEVNQFIDEKGISAAQSDAELSDEQLEAVAGGKSGPIGALEGAAEGAVKGFLGQ